MNKRDRSLFANLEFIGVASVSTILLLAGVASIWATVNLALLLPAPRPFASQPVVAVLGYGLFLLPPSVMGVVFLVLGLSVARGVVPGPSLNGWKRARAIVLWSLGSCWLAWCPRTVIAAVTYQTGTRIDPSQLLEAAILAGMLFTLWQGWPVEPPGVQVTKGGGVEDV